MESGKVNFFAPYNLRLFNRESDDVTKYFVDRSKNRLNDVIFAQSSVDPWPTLV